MAEPKQSSLSEEKTSVIGNSKEEKQSMVHEKETHGRSEDIDDKTSVIGNSKEEKQSMVHEKETHGRSEDIDEKTRVDDVKGPGFIERMKEEMEAIVDAVTPNKSSDK